MRRAALVVACAAVACSRGGSSSAARSPCFVDVTREVGLDFVHENGASGHKYFVETNGSGAAWLDFDGDGDLDLVCVQGAALPGFTPTRPLHAQLYRNDRGRFVDVTASSKLACDGQGMAACAGDYDNDGDADLYVTNFGRDTLWRNEGDGTFLDVTERAHVADGDRYHSSCAWADFDRDGDLDLYVAGYVDFRVDDGKVCGELQRGEAYRSYCSPDLYDGIDDALYRNDGDGTFTDVSKEAGLAGAKGKGLGVAIGDFDDDGDVDAFVANDSDVNFLWRNDSTRDAIRLVDVAPAWGVDYDGEGRTQACMGCAFGDVDGDARLDLFTVNLANEYNTLYVHRGDHYADESYPSGLAGPSLPLVGFGTLFGDFDGDGDLDVAVANGHVLDNPELTSPGTTWRQRASLYWNDGRGKFALATPQDAGAYFGEEHVGRGLAVADFDDDGDLDLLFTNSREPARLLRNERGNASAWIGFALTGTRSNRDAIGAEVWIHSRGRTIRRCVRAGESYLCSHDRRVLVGLSDDRGPVDVEIRWPSGTRQELSALAVGRYHPVLEPR
jgi:hypothetical protein